METLARKLKSLEDILRLREGLRARARRLAFTNGCFDILHAGHVRYLNRARALADVLVVGVNSDRSVRGIKGPGRPLVPEMERVEVLAALECVDFLLVFDDPTPRSVIDRILPDVLVKGSDWKLADVVGRDTVTAHGGSVHTIPLVEGASTTGIIRMVLERFGTPSRSIP